MTASFNLNDYLPFLVDFCGNFAHPNDLFELGKLTDPNFKMDEYRHPAVKILRSAFSYENMAKDIFNDLVSHHENGEENFVTNVDMEGYLTASISHDDLWQSRELAVAAARMCYKKGDKYALIDCVPPNAEKDKLLLDNLDFFCVSNFESVGHFSDPDYGSLRVTGGSTVAETLELIKDPMPLIEGKTKLANMPRFFIDAIIGKERYRSALEGIKEIDGVLHLSMFPLLAYTGYFKEQRRVLPMPKCKPCTLKEEGFPKNALISAFYHYPIVENQRYLINPDNVYAAIESDADYFIIILPAALTGKAMAFAKEIHEATGKTVVLQHERSEYRPTQVNYFWSMDHGFLANKVNARCKSLTSISSDLFKGANNFNESLENF
ncbi:hypothetical protein [Vibrio phage vB_pir03]|nr:hypothetical protein [Vibrio phage vB_pir03]